MKCCFLFFIINCFFFGCSSNEIIQPSSQLEIVEVNPSKWTALVKQNILHLSQVYHLSPFFFTKKIKIQSQVAPHSHPVLTINTRNAERPHKILAQLLHEELHWWTSLNSKKTDLAIKELKKVYRTVPVSHKSQVPTTYQHLLICYMEFKALSFYLGKKTATSIIIEIMRKDKIYPWVYGQVLNNSKALEKILEKQNLLPPILKANKKSVTI